MLCLRLIPIEIDGRQTFRDIEGERRFANLAGSQQGNRREMANQMAKPVM